MKNIVRKRLITIFLIFCGIVGAILYYFFFTPLSKSKETVYVYIDEDDDIDSVYTKLSPLSSKHGLNAFRTMVRHSSYSDNIRSGRYAIESNDGAFMVFRHMKNGQQTPVRLTIPSVRTIDRLCGEIAKRMMMDSLQLYKTLTNNEKISSFGYDTATIACMFIPNTYELYWNIPIEKFLERMKKESDNFWNEERRSKANAMRLLPNEVITLASIVDEETAVDSEKPMVAGMYYNRLMLRSSEYPQGMPLQADPTIKFALKRFDLKRIYNAMLYINSPYNTYRNVGLPPGPIRIPTITGIDAVLNYTRHNYLYMCAKEDLSGTHNFATTYQEHQQNAKRYSDALNRIGIK